MKTLYQDLFTLEVSNLRSINVERDSGRTQPDQLNYTVTPLAQSVFRQIFDGILYRHTQRAFSITGVYGTGKSAFIIALMELLLDPSLQNHIAGQIHNLEPVLFQDLSTIHQKFRIFLPVVLSGSREPLLPALHRALDQALRTAPSECTELIGRLEDLPPEDVTSLVALYEDAAKYFGGCLLVVDEFGKFLEYAASRPDQGDVFILQLLAEAAARSGDHPLLVFTVLHQAFGAYGTQLSQVQREEWNKIQGRFLDIPFNQSQDILIRLLAESINARSGSDLDRVRSYVEMLANQCTNKGLRLGALTAHETEVLAVKTAPIHPLVIFLFGPFFRRLAQNERSMFAFLRSTDRASFRTFLETASLTADSVPVYGLAHLYDYIMDTMGPSLLGSTAGRNWVLAEETLARLDEGEALDTALVKVIGLIAALGDSTTLRADAELLALAVSKPVGAVEEALKRLVQQKLVVYRRFIDAYRLWEGSDFDLDAALQQFRGIVDEGTPLADLLQVNLPQAPMEAKRHSFRTGTLRIFPVHYADLDSLSTLLATDEQRDSDGLIIFLLVSQQVPDEKLQEKLAILSRSRSLPLIVIPVSVPTSLHEAALELARLQVISDRHPDLENDRVARREVSERIAQLGGHIQQQLDVLLSPRDRALTCWYVGTGDSTAEPQFRLVHGRKGLNQLLSFLCDQVFHASPLIRNELINRRGLSSQGASARRELLGLMLTAQTLPAFGIEQAPPHLSMYRSVLEASRLHRLGDDGQTWQFAAPTVENDPLKLLPTWQAFEGFLERSATTRQPVSALWEELKRPPYGAREGVIPVLFLAMLLLKGAEVGVYENGNFVADLEAHHIERMVKAPEKFELRYSPLTEARQEFFQELGPYISVARTGQLVPVVRTLIRTVSKLPDYAKRTRELTPAAKKVRDALLTAREPDLLLYTQLPIALGFAPLTEEHVTNHSAASVVKALITTLRELNMAHGELLDRLFDKLKVALGLPANRSEALQKLRAEVDLLPREGVDLRLKGFINHLEPPPDEAGFGPWMESFGSFVASRPPMTWNDDDEVKYDLELQKLANKLRQVKDMAVARGRMKVAPGTEAIRIGLTNQRGEELHQVLFVRPIIRERALEAADRVAHLLSDMGVKDPSDQLALLTLIAQTRIGPK